MSPDQVLSFLQKGGALAALILVLLGGHLRLWVYRWVYDERMRELRQAHVDLEKARAERDKYKILTGRATDAAERASNRKR